MTRDEAARRRRETAARDADTRARPQPHIHPQPGPRDSRGNCPGCAAYNPETAR